PRDVRGRILDRTEAPDAREVRLRTDRLRTNRQPGQVTIGERADVEPVRQRHARARIGDPQNEDWPRADDNEELPRVPQSGAELGRGTEAAAGVAELPDDQGPEEEAAANSR